jgi:hypothetical protein
MELPDSLCAKDRPVEFQLEYFMLFPEFFSC